MSFILSLLKETRYASLTTVAVILALNSYFFIERKSTNQFPLIFDEVRIHYFIYLICFSLIGIILFKLRKKQQIVLSKLISITFLTLLPLEITLILSIYILHDSTTAHFIFYFFAGLYLVLYSVFFIEMHQSFLQKTKKSNSLIISWFKKQGSVYIFILALALSVFGYFGINKIANYAAVDEPLWTFERIPRFWKNLAEGDWKNTAVSDKPGITVAIISGVGLLHNNPLDYAELKSFDPKKDIHVMNQAFRLPIIIFCLLSIIIFYIFIQKLFNKDVAILVVALISTSPMLVGMSRIINPDSILWVFVPLTILAYLVYLKEKTRFWLYLSGILLGLSILTKYVANILYIFFFALIFFEYFFISKNKKVFLKNYLRDSLFNFTSLTLVSLITFFFLLPKTWIKLKALFTGTIWSQAFESIAPIFIGIIALLLLDIFLLKNKLSQPIFKFFHKYQSFIILTILGLFSAFTLFVFVNTYSNMKFVNFEAILSSPKSSYLTNSLLTIFSTNFYPLIFASLPIVLLGLFFALFYVIKRNKENNLSIKIIIYFIFFILLYNLGSTFNEVVSIIRYQVILYPLLLIVSAIGIYQFLKLFPTKKYLVPFSALAILFIGTLTLLDNKPFYLGYASKLLPTKYFVDTKDMGDGSYEVAQYLNSLPDAKNLSIWTDKTGLCPFVLGKCDSFYDTPTFLTAEIDYFVVSSGRKNKFLGAISRRENIPYNFEDIYNSDNPEFSIYINDRPGNFVKVLSAEQFKK